jgi:hypothetical protein
MLAPLDGMYLPFAATAAEREQRGDPRPAVLQRYPSRADYLGRMSEAALELHRQRFLLADDVVAVLQAAAAKADEIWEVKNGNGKDK